MAGKFVSRWFFAALGKYEVETGLFRKEIEKHTSQRHVDFDDYAKELREIYEELDSDGYDVINIVPISMGQSESCVQKGGRYVGDVGFSITRGAVVIGKKREG